VESDSAVLCSVVQGTLATHTPHYMNPMRAYNEAAVDVVNWLPGYRDRKTITLVNCEICCVWDFTHLPREVSLLVSCFSMYEPLHCEWSAAEL